MAYIIQLGFSLFVVAVGALSFPSLLVSGPNCGTVVLLRHMKKHWVVGMEAIKDHIDVDAIKVDDSLVDILLIGAIVAILKEELDKAVY